MIEATMKTNININIASDQWITGVFLDEKNHRLYVIINESILVGNINHYCYYCEFSLSPFLSVSQIFDCNTAEEVRRLNHISERQITCVSYFNEYEFIIAGCSNGRGNSMSVSCDSYQNLLL